MEVCTIHIQSAVKGFKKQTIFMSKRPRSVAWTWMHALQCCLPRPHFFFLQYVTLACCYGVGFCKLPLAHYRHSTQATTQADMLSPYPTVYKRPNHTLNSGLIKPSCACACAYERVCMWGYILSCIIDTSLSSSSSLRILVPNTYRKEEERVAEEGREEVCQEGGQVGEEEQQGTDLAVALQNLFRCHPLSVLQATDSPKEEEKNHCRPAQRSQRSQRSRRQKVDPPVDPAPLFLSLSHCWPGRGL